MPKPWVFIKGLFVAITAYLILNVIWNEFGNTFVLPGFCFE